MNTSHSGHRPATSFPSASPAASASWWPGPASACQLLSLQPSRRWKRAWSLGQYFCFKYYFHFYFLYIFLDCPPGQLDHCIVALPNSLLKVIQPSYHAPLVPHPQRFTRSRKCQESKFFNFTHELILICHHISPLAVASIRAPLLAAAAPWRCCHAGLGLHRCDSGLSGSHARCQTLSLLERGFSRTK